MFWHRNTPSAPRMTDSDVRWTLLLAAMRAFREAEAQRDLAAREGPLMAEFAERVVLPEPSTGAWPAAQASALVTTSSVSFDSPSVP